jgi:cysteine desulfurase/selenocysteine lyase
MQAFKDMLSEKTKVVALVYVSNMLGSILDTDYIAEETHKVRNTCNLMSSYVDLEASRTLLWGSHVTTSGILMALQVGAKLLLDCSQVVPNMPVDVQSLGADWIVATGHKFCGPTGIGFLWGR